MTIVESKLIKITVPNDIINESIHKNTGTVKLSYKTYYCS